MEKDLKSRAKLVAFLLESHYPAAGIILDYKTPFQLLTAVILSAQCTDKKVNEVTASFFDRLKSPEDFDSLSQEELEKLIRPTGFFRNKARNIKGAARLLIERYGGKIPDSMNEILKLPGVARKTGNIILGNIYGVVEGIAVDTHVSRLSFRLGFSMNKEPEKIEKDLMELFPRELWFKLTYLLIEHGRAACDAKKPRCVDCFLLSQCPGSGVLLKTPSQ